MTVSEVTDPEVTVFAIVPEVTVQEVTVSEVTVPEVTWHRNNICTNANIGDFDFFMLILVAAELI